MWMRSCSSTSWAEGSAIAAKRGEAFCVPRDLQSSAVVNAAEGEELFTRVHSRAKVSQRLLCLLLLLLLLLLQYLPVLLASEVLREPADEKGKSPLYSLLHSMDIDSGSGAAAIAAAAAGGRS